MILLKMKIYLIMIKKKINKIILNDNIKYIIILFEKNIYIENLIINNI